MSYFFKSVSVVENNDIVGLMERWHKMPWSMVRQELFDSVGERTREKLEKCFAELEENAKSAILQLQEEKDQAGRMFARQFLDACSGIEAKEKIALEKAPLMVEQQLIFKVRKLKSMNYSEKFIESFVCPAQAGFARSVQTNQSTISDGAQRKLKEIKENYLSNLARLKAETQQQIRNCLHRVEQEYRQLAFEAIKKTHQIRGIWDSFPTRPIR